MGIIPSCSHVSTAVWLHQLDFNEALREKGRWELHKNIACCLEQILEAAPHKIAAVLWEYNQPMHFTKWKSYPMLSLLVLSRSNQDAWVQDCPQKEEQGKKEKNWVYVV